MNVKNFLRNIPLFADLSDDELDLVLTSSQKIHYKKNNIIFYEGDPGDYLLVVLSGKIKVVLLGEHGQELILAILEPGSYVGEMSLLEGAPRSATIMTMEHSDFIRLARDPILELIKQHHSLAMKVLLTLSKRVREVSEQLRSMSMFDVYGRIIRCLIRLSQHDGARPTSRLVIENRPSNRDLAKMIGCTRESVSRAMRVLQDNQFVTAVKKDIVIEQRALHRYWDFGM